VSDESIHIGIDGWYLWLDDDTKVGPFDTWEEADAERWRLRRKREQAEYARG